MGFIMCFNEGGNMFIGLLIRVELALAVLSILVETSHSYHLIPLLWNTGQSSMYPMI